MLVLLNRVLVVVVTSPECFPGPSAGPYFLPPCGREPLETLLSGGSILPRDPLASAFSPPTRVGHEKNRFLSEVTVVSPSCPKCSQNTAEKVKMR